MANPDLWIETYESPTWTEYVRHNLRPTKADAAVRDAIRALHEGNEPPVVRRMIERPTNWLAAVRGPRTGPGPE
jgi:hypothetical protein